jgi:hypothetical protein
MNGGVRMKSAAGLNKSRLRQAGREAFDDSGAPSRANPSLWQLAHAWWKRFRQLSRRRPRCLRLCESLPLGEHRFVAVVEFERWRFLVGGTAASLVLLARLETVQASGEEKNDEKKRDENKKEDREAKGAEQKNQIAPPDNLATGISARWQS